MTKFYLYLRRYLLAVLLLLTSIIAWSQRTVTGKVTSAEDGSGIPGVNVLVKGTSTGTATDAEGNFSISASDNAILVFSFVGYATQEVAIGAQSSVNVSMATDVTALSEVVVIGYGSVNQRDATGAIASVKSEDFNKGVIASPEQLIQGRTAGVNVTSAGGEPGGGVSIRIRGTASVRGGSNPLFVVDGVPLTGDDVSSGANDTFGRGSSSARNPLNFINPADIESIDILKDASATAIYGSRGANGVVLIKTKNGRGTKNQLTFNTSFNISNQAKFYDLLKRDDFLAGVAKFGGDPVVQDYGASTDWQKEITRTGLSQKYDLAYSDTYETGNYRAAISYDRQEGVIKESGLERLTGRLNFNNDFLDNKLHFGTQLTFSRIKDEYAPITDNAGFEGDLLGAAYMANPTWVADPEIQPLSTNLNPLSYLEYHQDRGITNRSLINLSLDYDILTELNFRVNVGFDRANSTRGTVYSPLLNTTNGITGNGRAYLSDLHNGSNLLEAFFNYKKAFENSNLNAVVGYSYQQFDREGTNTNGWGFNGLNMNGMLTDLNTSASAIRRNIGTNYQGFGFTKSPKNLWITRLSPTPNILAFPYNNSAVNVKTVTEDTFEYQDELQSFFGRVNYTINNKYLFTATVRADGSTKFGGNNKYGVFPSAAAAWRLSDEGFIPEFFDDLKLRAGYGITGNQEIPHNLHQSRQRYGAPTINQGGNADQPGLNNVAFANPDLKWEQTAQLNFGVDFGFFKRRLTGTIDYYSKKTTDFLIQVRSTQPAPQPFSWLNIDGDIINNGVEFTLNYKVVEKTDFTFDVGFNISFNENKVENMTGVVDTGDIDGQGLTDAFAQRIQSGQPLYAWFIRDFTGYDENGFATYTKDAQQFLGGKSPIPKSIFGLSLNATFKNWDASIFLTGQNGHYIYSNTANAYFTAGSIGNARNVTKDVIASGESNYNSPDASTAFLEKGDFVRLQNASVGYNFKFNTKAIKKLYAYVGGQNLFVITDYSGLDPEVNKNKAISGVPSLGIDYTTYPKARTFMIGLNATF